jgi:hypothetical protein
MAYGVWLMAHGSWLMAHGSWLMAHGSWLMAHGSAWSTMVVAHGWWIMVDYLLSQQLMVGRDELKNHTEMTETLNCGVGS